jgi:hypothetical protein
MKYALARGWDFNLGQSKSTWMKHPSGKWEQLKDTSFSVMPKEMTLCWEFDIILSSVDQEKSSQRSQ